MASNRDKRALSKSGAAAVRGVVPADVMGPRLLYVVICAVLTLIGIVMVYSASSVEALNNGADPASEVIKQVVFAIMGVTGAFVCAKLLPYDAWKGWAAWALWGGSVLLIVLTAAVGTEELGAQRWVNIGPVSLQPSEFAKIGFVLMAARLMEQIREGLAEWKDVLVTAGWTLGIPLIFLLVTQSDLGTTAVCMVGIVAVMWAADMPGRAMALIAVFVVVFVFAMILVAPYRAARLTSFIDPWKDALGTGYQLIHSFYAFSEGGLFGVGLGNSSEKFQYLPEAETDFIFSIIGEEFGLVGALVVIGLFLALLYAGLGIARKAPDRYGAMLACGLTVMLVFQAFLNMACVIGLAPTTGKPIPFISSGGSSLIASMLISGIILNVSFASDAPDQHDRRRADLRIVRSEPVSRGLSSHRGPSVGERPAGRSVRRPSSPKRTRPEASRGGYRSGGVRDARGRRHR